MERVSSKEEARRAVFEAKRESKTVALVPTMGALHEGHLSLVRAACSRADYVAVSIFVNPTQFSAEEGFGAYPRNMDRDLELLAAEGVDLVFTPGTETMYSRDASVTVDPGSLASKWEGESRPTHFTGVATVVCKLLNTVRPDLAFFGEKDYQQLKIIERMVRDLDLPVTIVGCPTVREADGLAMSSRNVHLSAEERRAALALSDSLHAAVESIAWGECDTGALQRTMTERLTTTEGLDLDYAAVVDAETLDRIDRVERPARAIVAALAGATRLIDNVALVPPTEAG